MLTILIDPEKRSAGLLVVAGKRILLLRRSRRSGNGGTWGLPGGQLDRREPVYAAAVRESIEELAGLPRHAVVGHAAVQRRARRYEVLACRVPRDTRRAWAPTLNHEHDDWRWVTRSWCREHRHRLHPVVRALVDDPAGRRWLRDMVRCEEPAALPGGRRASDGLWRAA